MNILAPISIIIFGVSIIINPSFYWEKHGIHMNFTEARWILGPFAIVFGLYWFWLNSKIKKKGVEIQKFNNLICPKCKQAYPIGKDKFIKKCTKCQMDLLTLEEFLEHIRG